MTFIVCDIHDPQDSPIEQRFTSLLIRMVCGEIEPASAAQSLNTLVVDDCLAAYFSWTSVPTSEAQQRFEAGEISAPGPNGWRQFLWICIGKLAMQIPYDYPGQRRVVDLLRNLKELPPSKLHQYSSNEKGLYETELWSITPETGYGGLEQWMWEVNEGHFVGGRQEKESNMAASYLNFSAFQARLLASGVCDTTRICALTSPPPHRYQPCSSAAALWIIHAGDAIFELCSNDAILNVGSRKWTSRVWNQWKGRFEFMVGNKEFSMSSREFTLPALNRMHQLESNGYSGGAIETFRYMIPQMDEDGDLSYAGRG